MKEVFISTIFYELALTSQNNMEKNLFRLINKFDKLTKIIEKNQLIFQVVIFFSYRTLNL